jgi:RNA:NAD 2'-phosphotransferase (TPT1/KptA family)
MAEIYPYPTSAPPPGDNAGARPRSEAAVRAGRRCYFPAVEHARAIRLSKLLRFGLRHDPEALGLVLDDAGWVSVDLLLLALPARGEVITRAELEELVRGSDKQRFALSEDGARIRANQGHSRGDVPPGTSSGRSFPFSSPLPN